MDSNTQPPARRLCEVVAEAETLWELGHRHGWRIVPDLCATYRKRRHKLSPRQRAVLERYLASCAGKLDT